MVGPGVALPDEQHGTRKEGRQPSCELSHSSTSPAYEILTIILILILRKVSLCCVFDVLDNGGCNVQECLELLQLFSDHTLIPWLPAIVWSSPGCSTTVGMDANANTPAAGDVGDANVDANPNDPTITLQSPTERRIRC